MARSSLPPGFRFHPTDVELVQYYLKRKVLGKKLHIHAIAVVDIYKFDPWDLPAQSCLRTRDLEWYFFCPRDKKHSNGARTNRATEKGYWKTTGKDRPIFYETRSVGWKKTLVFHLGRAPQGKRTDWVIHEYRLEDKRLAEAGTRQDAFVLCRLFEKSGLGPKNGEQYGAPFVEEEWEDDLAEEGQLELPILDVASSSHAEVVDPGVAAQLALVVCAPANSEAPNVHQSALVMAEDSSPFDRSCPDASIPFDEEFDIEALLAEILSDSPDVPHTATTDAGQLVIRHGGAEYDQEEIFNDLDNLNPLQVLPPNNMDVVYDTEIELLNLGGCSDTAYMGLYEPDVEVNHSGWQHTDELFYHQHQPPVPAVDPNKKQPASSGSCYSSTTNYHCYNR